MMPVWVRELADSFWADAGEREPFPRRLRLPLQRAHDVVIRELPGLGIHKAENFLAHRGIHYRSRQPDRPLRACVAARAGTAWIFLDADDPDDEKTASLAHEAAHLLRHCVQPRRRAIRAMGPGITAVLDGEREPTPGERLHAILRDVELGVHVHHLHRETFGLAPSLSKLEAEADQFARELLAPVDEVRSRVGDHWEPDHLRTLLTQEFGLSATMTRDYATSLFREPDDSPVVRKLTGSLCGRRSRGPSWE